MIIFPNCKLNLGLNVIRKRDDGYHDLETVFYPIDICDALEIITAEETQPVSFFSTGLNTGSNEQKNLCVKAYHLLKKDFPQLPSVKLHLHKAIPIGAGLGGGSADAAFTLILLNKKFQLDLSREQLIDYASRLGSDCAFFVINKTCFAQGKGEILQSLSLDLSAYKFLVVNPNIHISTPWAYSKIEPVVPSLSIKEIIHQPVSAWKDILTNDFEKPVMQQYPLIETLKEELYNLGAVYASMSGSGSTCFGIFLKDHKIDTSVFPSSYFLKLADGLQ